MINLKTIIFLSITICYSCSKYAEESETNGSQSTIQTEINQENTPKLTLTELELENVFKDLNETNLALGSIILGFPIVDLYNINDPNLNPIPNPVNGTERKFKFNILGIRSAVKYAGEILEKGGCIKAWLDDDGMINVEEIPC